MVEAGSSSDPELQVPSVAGRPRHAGLLVPVNVNIVELAQIDVAPGGFVAVIVNHLQVVLAAARIAGERDVDLVAVVEAAGAQNIAAPGLLANRADEHFVDRVAGGVIEREVLFRGMRGGSGEAQHGGGEQWFEHRMHGNSLSYVVENYVVGKFSVGKHGTALARRVAHAPGASACRKGDG